MVSLLKTLRYLHLVTGVGVLLTGLFQSIPFFTQSAPINHIGLLAILTGLINLQRGRVENDKSRRLTVCNGKM